MTHFQSAQTMLHTAWQRFRKMLGTQVDGRSLAVFRAILGVVFAWHAFKFLKPMSDGSLRQVHYVDVGWNFPYPGFEWLRPWPEPWLTVHFAVIVTAGLLVAAGLFYRTAMVTLFLTFTAYFLFDEAFYNNHYYLMSLMLFLLIWMPAATRFSVDGWWKSRLRRSRALSGDVLAEEQSTGPPSVPFWPIFLLRAQLFILYFFGGIAKINHDWLTGIPLLSIGNKLRRMVSSVVPVPDWAGVQEFCLFLAWTGMIYDLVIGFLLIFRRTRLLGIVLTAVFHGTNEHLFPIGVFPFMAFASTLIFLEPDWPGQLWGWLKRPRLIYPDWKWLVGGALLVPVVGAALGWKRETAASNGGRPSGVPARRLITGFVTVWLVLQVLIPLRHFLVEGDANWTEEGHRFSWRMMLRAKKAGHVLYEIRDPAVQVFGADGKPEIDWSRWPDAESQKVYVPVNSPVFDWFQHPGLLMTYEPEVGERIFYNPNHVPLRADDDLAGFRAKVNAQWEKAFHRRPKITETVTLPEALARARSRLNKVKPDSAAAREELAQHLEAINDIIWAFTPKGREKLEMSDQRLVAIAGEIAKLVQSRHGTIVRNELRRTHPFAIQGAEFPGLRFLLIEDRELPEKGRTQELRKLSVGKPYVVWVDLLRLRPNGWRGLPLAFVTFERKGPRIQWNHFRELNVTQADKAAVRPYMLHQYAGHIADVWEQKTKRRPAVHVRAYVLLNYYRPRYLIDPNVDLAGTPYNYFGHNDWIMPFERDEQEIVIKKGRQGPARIAKESAPGKQSTKRQ